MFNKTFFVALVLCACFFSAILARPQLGTGALPNPAALLGSAGGVAAPAMAAVTGLGASGLASSLPAAAMSALNPAKVL